MCENIRPKTNMTGEQKKSTMNESMYFLFEKWDFPASHLSFQVVNFAACKHIYRLAIHQIFPVMAE